MLNQLSREVFCLIKRKSGDFSMETTRVNYFGKLLELVNLCNSSEPYILNFFEVTKR